VREYEFTLVFGLAAVEAAPDDYVELLAGHGCDDAIVGIGRPGRVALGFSRARGSAREAVLSALADVKRALPAAVLLEAKPDFVGVTEIADLVGRSRQNIRKLLVNCRAPAPAPVHDGGSPLWHLAHILDWLRDEKRYVIDAGLGEVAHTTMQLNVAVDRRNVDDLAQKEIESLLA